MRERVLITSVLLAAVVLAGGAAADAPSDLSAVHSNMSGSGTADDPWVITNAEELRAIEHDTTSDAHYVIGNDINATGTAEWNGGVGFTPISGGTSGYFSGALNGSEREITGLTINATNDNVALFESISQGGTVENLGFRRAHVESDLDAAVVAANLAGSSEINNVYAVNATVQSNNAAGIIVDQRQNAAARNIRFSGDVSGVNDAAGLIVNIGSSDGDVVLDGGEVVGNVSGDNPSGAIQTVGFNATVSNVTVYSVNFTGEFTESDFIGTISDNGTSTITNNPGYVNDSDATITLFNDDDDGDPLLGGGAEEDDGPGIVLLAVLVIAGAALFARRDG